MPALLAGELLTLRQHSLQRVRVRQEGYRQCDKILYTLLRQRVRQGAPEAIEGALYVISQ